MDMKHLLSTAIAVAGVLFAAQPASAAALTYLYELEVANAEGLAYDADDGSLWVARGGVVGGVANIDPVSGEVNSSFQLGSSDRAFGISMFEAELGQRLLVSDSAGTLYEYQKSGAYVREFVTLPLSDDGDGLFFDPDANEIIVADDTDEMIYFFRAPSGAELNSVGYGAAAAVLIDSFSTLDIDPDFNDPQGLAMDPETGNILVLDGKQGASSLYELTRDGALVSVTDLLALTLFEDPSGITFGPDGMLFIAFADADRIVAFDFESGGAVIPVPAALPLLATGLACLGLLSRRRKRPYKSSWG